MNGEFDPTKGPHYGGSIGRDGKFYPPDPALQEKQKSHHKGTIHQALEAMLSGIVVKGDGDSVSEIDRIESAASMLVGFVDDDDAQNLFKRVQSFVQRAREKGVHDSGVRSEAQALMAELEEYRDFDFYASGDAQESEFE